MFGAVWAQAELRKVLAAPAPASSRASLPVAGGALRFDEDGRLVDEEIRTGLEELVRTLVASAVREPIAA